MKSAAAARMRLAGMIRKESLQILRDPSSIAIAFVMPVVLLLLFGYGVSLDARHIPLAMVVEQPDANSASLVGAFQRSNYFVPQAFGNIQDGATGLRSARSVRHRLAAQRFQRALAVTGRGAASA